MRRLSGLVLLGGVLGFGVLFALPAAGQFFTALEVSYTETAFEPEYTYMYDRPNSKYKNWAYGAEFDLVGGYRFEVNPTFSLAVATSLGISTAEWSLDTTDPETHLDYKIPYRVFVALQPSIRLADNWRLFGDLGVGKGNIQERKTSPERSRYDFDEWLWGYRIGGGLAYEVREGWELSMAYRYFTYDAFRYDTHLPDGTHWETVVDEPYAHSVMLGLAKYW